MPFSQVVLKTKQNEVLKGTTSDFSPVKASFHLIPLGEETSHSSVEVIVNELKAIFFVKDFEGTAYRDNYQSALIRPKVGEKLIKVKFHDGEQINGIAQSFHLDRPGFFITPTDPASNNERIFVVLSDLESLNVDGKAIPIEQLRQSGRKCPSCNAPMDFSWRWCPFDGSKLR